MSDPVKRERRRWVVMIVCGAVPIALLPWAWLTQDPSTFARLWGANVWIAIGGAGMVVAGILSLRRIARNERRQ